MSLSSTVVKKPTTIFIIFLIFIGLGLYSSRDLAIDLYPDITFPSLFVICDNSGVSPEEIEKTITRPLESSLGGVSNITKVSSISSEGSSIVTLEFKYGTDMNEVTNEVRDGIDFIKAALPDEASTPRIFKFSSAMIPIMFLSINGNKTAEELKEIEEDIVAPRLEQVAGVATAGVNGGKDRTIRIEISHNRLNAYNLSISQLSKILSSQNVDKSAGTIDEGDFKYIIQTSGQYTSLDEIKNTVVAYIGGTAIKVDDIATVVDGYGEDAQIVNLNGKPGVTMIIQKQSGVNSVKTAEGVLKKIDSLNKELPKGVHIDVFYNQTVQIKKSIGMVSSTAILGGILAILILFVFLRNFKSVLIIGLSIPISVIITLMFMYIFGLTLNMMTLAGLALGIGMLVDNSIVILENIFRYREKGAKLKTSAILGSQEMTTAILASTLTTICVFLPLVIFKQQIGIVGELVGALAFTVVFSLTASILVGIFFVPILSSHYFPITSKSERILPGFLQKIDDKFENFFTNFDNLYKKALRVTLNHRKIAVLIVFVIFIISVFLIPTAGINFLPTQSSDVIQLDISLPVGTRLEITKNIMDKLELIARNEINGFEDILVRSGERSFFGFMGSVNTHKGMLMVTLPEFNKRIDTEPIIKEKLRKHFNEFPGVEMDFVANGGPGGGSSSYPIDLIIKSDSMDIAKKTALNIVELLKSNISEVTEPSINLEEGLPRLEIEINRERAYNLGLNIFNISSEIEANIKGIVSSRYVEDGKEYDILLILEKEDRSKIPDLEQIFIINNQGIKIPLSSIVKFVKTTGPTQINREDQMKTIHVEGGLKPGAKLNQVVSKINKLLNQNLTKSDDVIVIWGGDASDMKEIGLKFIAILLISIFLVFGVMASQFESFLDPFIIFFTIPLMLIGVVFIYILTGEMFSMFTAVGLVILSGIVVNNGIVLVDYTNLLRNRGLSIKDACVEAGGNRLRPILMTTLTTILGMSPMAFISGEGSELSQPIAKTIVGGLSISALFTLFLIPVVYSIFNEMSEKRKEKLRQKEKQRREIRKERLERSKVLEENNNK